MRVFFFGGEFQERDRCAFVFPPVLFISDTTHNDTEEREREIERDVREREE